MSSHMRIDDLILFRMLVAAKYELDKNFDHIPTVKEAENSNLHPYGIHDGYESVVTSYNATKMLELWWKLDSLIKDLQKQNVTYAQIPILNKPYDASEAMSMLHISRSLHDT